MKRLKLLATFALLATSLAAIPSWAIPISVQSTLFDFDNDVLTVGPAAQSPTGDPVTNGSFIIYRLADAVDLPVGNGIDDRTNGLFDFRSDPNYAAFFGQLQQVHGKLNNALLSLVLTPMHPNYLNDQINLENGPFLGDPEIGSQLENNPLLPNEMSKQVTLNLLNYYTTEQISNYLSGGVGDFLTDGRILLTYSDDATVSGMNLLLTSDVPEPGTWALMLAALLAMVATGKQRARSINPSQSESQLRLTRLLQALTPF